MRGLFLSALMLAVIGASPGLANAQPGLSTGLDPAGADRANRIEEEARRGVMKIRKEGIDALQAQDFVAAEKSFGALLARNPTTNDANYLMGLAKLGLRNWADARQYLEAAVKKEPARAEPKSRLGVAYIRLNDMDAANKQRAELAGLDAKCKSKCPDAAAIADSLRILDQALAPKPAASSPAP